MAQKIPIVYPRGGKTAMGLTDLFEQFRTDLATLYDGLVEPVLQLDSNLQQTTEENHKQIAVQINEDTLPPRVLLDARPTGGAAGVLPELEPMLAEYYQLRGWTPDGRIPDDKLADVGLAEYAAQT